MQVDNKTNISKDDDKSKNNKRSRNTVIVLIILLLLLLLLLVRCNSDPTPPPLPTQNNSIEWDDTATEGVDIEGLSKEEIEALLNEKVAASMINISMSTHPVFESGTSEGTANIVNNTINNYPQQVSIVVTESNEELYASKAIPVGSKIEKIKLSKDLDPGDYECTATFSALNPENGKIIGQAKSNIIITINN